MTNVEKIATLLYDVDAGYIPTGNKAKYLSANGCIVKKYGLGQRFWWVSDLPFSPVLESHIDSETIVEIRITENGVTYCGDYLTFTEDEVGDTIFFDKEEAEEMLKTRECER